MPLVRITLRKGRTRDYVRDASNAIHDALVATANVPADDRFHVIEEVDDDRLIAHPSYGGVNRSDNVIFVQITLNTGRTIDVKRALYADIAKRLQECVDMRPDDVVISLIEVSKEDWSFGGGRMTYGLPG